MYLVAEQVAYLRRKKRELLDSRKKYREMLSSREKSAMEGIGLPAYIDSNLVEELYRTKEELDSVTEALATGEYLRGRTFDYVNVGTRVKVRFSDGDTDEVMLIDAGTPSYSSNEARLSSDFGIAVFGKEEGANVSYKVSSTGRQVSLTIEEIDKIKSHYDSFITERARKNRLSRQARKDIHDLTNNPEEYKKRHQYTISQLFLINEEINKIGRNATPSEIRRKAYLERYLKENTLVEPPKDNTIGIGSIVSILIRNEDGTSEERDFELINEAVSTEVDSEYVERISTLGQALYGKKAGDSFKLRRSNQSSLNGIVLTVDNTNTLENEKHR